MSNQLLVPGDDTMVVSKRWTARDWLRAIGILVLIYVVTVVAVSLMMDQPFLPPDLWAQIKELWPFDKGFFPSVGN